MSSCSISSARKRPTCSRRLVYLFLPPCRAWYIILYSSCQSKTGIAGYPTVAVHSGPGDLERFKSSFWYEVCTFQQTVKQLLAVCLPESGTLSLTSTCLSAAPQTSVRDIPLYTKPWPCINLSQKSRTCEPEARTSLMEAWDKPNSRYCTLLPCRTVALFILYKPFV